MEGWLCPLMSGTMCVRVHNFPASPSCQCVMDVYLVVSGTDLFGHQTLTFDGVMPLGTADVSAIIDSS